jgi:hypothetical protein
VFDLTINDLLIAKPTSMTTNADLPREAREGPIFHPDWGTHAYEGTMAISAN